MQNASHSNYSGLEELLHAEVMTGYNRFIVDTARRAVEPARRGVDFGAGIGTHAVIFRDVYGLDLSCVEIDPRNIEYLRDRGFEATGSLEALPEPVEFFFSSNVLEHIEDDRAILQAMREKLRPGGRIFLYLPAHARLWSELDVRVGHYRRYERSGLRRLAESLGLRVIQLHYADSLGFLASLAMKLFGYDSERGIGSTASLKFYDRYLFPVSRLLDRLGMKYLVGKNLVLVAEKPVGPA